MITEKIRKNTFLFFILITGISATSQVNPVWTSRYTSAGNFVDKAKAMTIDAKGNVYITGTSNAGANGFDYITVKFNSNGVQQWVATYNGPGNGIDEPRAIIVGADSSVFVTGWSAGAGANYDMATVKYNYAGVQQWASRYNGTGNANDEGNAIALDSDGNVYASGASDGSGTGSDYATVKYNPAGVQQWASRYNTGGSRADAAYAIYVRGNGTTGNVYVTGSGEFAANNFDIITQKLNASTGASAAGFPVRYSGPANNYDAGTDITVDASGLIYVTGYERATGSGTNYDCVTLKYNAAGGVPVWVSKYPGTANDFDRLNAIAVDGGGSVYVTGRAVNTGTAQDVVTIKYTPSGVQRWVRIYDAGVVNYDEGRDIILDAAANVYVTGYSYLGSSNHDFLSLKYDSTGVRQWIARYNGTGNNIDQAVGIRADASGYVYVAGVSRGTSSNEDYAAIKYCQFGIKATNDVSLCQGKSTTLTVTGGTGAYTWTPATGLSSTTAGSVTANPMVTTTYIITGKNAIGCTDQDTVVVTVNANPTASVTKNPTAAICQGDSVKITGTTNASFFTWSSGDTTLVFWKKNSGTFKLTVTDTNGCTNTAQVSVTVNNIPTVSVTPGGPHAFCQGDSVMLTVTASASFSWNTGGSASPLKVKTSGTYVVTATTAQGCKNTDTVFVNVKPLPSVTINASGPTTFCQGGFVNLTANSGFPIKWNTGDTTDFILADSSGTYIATTTDTAGCKNSDTTVVNVIQPPSLSITPSSPVTLCQGDSVTLTAVTTASVSWSNSKTTLSIVVKTPGAYSVTATNTFGCKSNASANVVQVAKPPKPVITFTPNVFSSSAPSGNQWLLNGSNISGATSQTYTAAVSGIYSVRVTVNGCSSTSDTMTVTIIGIDESDLARHLRIYPSPGNGKFTLDLSQGAEGNMIVEIHDLTGQRLQRVEEKISQQSFRKEFDFSQLPSGIYFVSVSTQKGNVVKRLHIVH